MKKNWIFLVVAIIFGACGQSSTTHKLEQTEEVKVVDVPTFSQDSAFSYVEAQLAFGPRVPGSPAHTQCANYLANKLRQFGASVQVQQAPVTTFDGKTFQLKNIIASFAPDKKQRILLMAHWDTRPFADMDSAEAKRKTPILGANDGASGVAVLLEMARHFGQKNPDAGIDIVLFDLEDYGAPRWASNQSTESWCLGSQHWAKNPHTEGYHAQYGILLDMVGAPGATFRREAISMHYAQDVVHKVWTAAAGLGYTAYFLAEDSPQIIDDHMFVNQLANIPSIDIIHHDATSEHYFAPYWHTHNDNLKAIDPATLKAVGQTVMHVVYHE